MWPTTAAALTRVQREVAGLSPPPWRGSGPGVLVAGAGLAVHLGAVLDIPSIGVTDRPLHAVGEAPRPERGATSPLLADGVETACMLRTRAAARPLVVHAGWRTDLNTAVSVALATTGDARTPEPLRCARHLARHARSAAGRPRTG